jgi:hypothetical protein
MRETIIGLAGTWRWFPADHGPSAWGGQVQALKWTHVAVVRGPSGGTIYLDGAPVGTNTAIKLRPSDFGSTTNNYIVRSQFCADPYFDGDVDEFRVYNQALLPDEIQALANGS